MGTAVDECAAFTLTMLYSETVYKKNLQSDLIQLDEQRLMRLY